MARARPAIQIELVPSDTLSNLLEREADIAVRMLRPTQGGLIARHRADGSVGFSLTSSCSPPPAARPGSKPHLAGAGSALTNRPR